MIKAILWGLVIFVILLLAMGSFIGDGAALQASPGMMSAQYKAMYLEAAKTCPGLPTEVLMAIGQIESGHGANDGPSYAGAIGPMQFMPATWVAYGVDGNHDGFADPFDPADAIPSAARLLCADGAADPKSLIDAVALYNPGDPTYPVAVMEVAKGYTKEVPGAPTATVTAPPTGTAPPH
jgi:membrane-bound lytic murein transglycosylase B